VTKYGFKIRTRGGMMVESLQVHARDREEAERKINQIYHQCAIVECQELTPASKPGGLDFEDVIALINKQESA
jgi:hypothetical protein